MGVSFLGIEISGFAKGTAIEVTFDEEAFKKYVGGDGDVARVRNANESGQIKFTLMQTSPVNDLLSAAAQLDRRTGSGIGTCTVKDTRGTSLHSSGDAWIQKIPDTTYADEIEVREWTLDCGHLDHFVGSGQV